MIPLVGGLIAAVPSVALALLHSPTAGIVTLVVFVGVPTRREPLHLSGGDEPIGADEPAVGTARRARRRQPRRRVRVVARRAGRCPGRHPGRECDPGDLPRGLGPDPAGAAHRRAARSPRQGRALPRRPLSPGNGGSPSGVGGPRRSGATTSTRTGRPVSTDVRGDGCRARPATGVGGGVLDPVDQGLVPYAASMKVLVVLPTYNESENIEHVLRRIRVAVPTATVLVVDDGSPDGTAKIAESLGEGARQHRGAPSDRRSPGSGAPTGRASAGASNAASTPASRWTPTSPTNPRRSRDCSHPLSEGCDLVIGSRYVPGRLHPRLDLAPATALAGRQPLRRRAARTRRRRLDRRVPRVLDGAARPDRPRSRSGRRGMASRSR